MADVAGAMAASSLLLETGSVASSGMDEQSRTKNPFSVSRTCICRLGPACASMSAAFALAKDSRGDFVVLPAHEIEMRAVFNRYLRSNEKESKEINWIGEGTKDKERNMQDDDHSVSYSDSCSGDDDEDYSDDASRSYSDSERSDDCSRSHSDSERSYDSQGSYSSRGSCSGRESYDDASKDSLSDKDSEKLEDWEDGKLDREVGPVEVRKKGNTNEHDNNLKTGRAKVYRAKQGVYAATGKRYISEMNDDEDCVEEYVAAYHFYPKVLDRYMDICQERRPEDDLIPLFITTMTLEDRRACDIPIQDDDYDRVDSSTRASADEQFWVVPSYSIAKAHEDWQELMRHRLRRQDLKLSAIERMPKPNRETQAAPGDSNSCGSLPKWQMACVLAQQLLDPEDPITREESSLCSQSTRVQIESKAGLKETTMLALALSASLTPQIISAPARKGHILCAVDGTTITKRKLLIDLPSKIEYPEPSKTTDEADSQRSFSTKSDCTITPCSPPETSMASKDLAVHGSSESKKLHGSVSMVVRVKGLMSQLPLLLCLSFLSCMVVATIYCAGVLTTQEEAIACSKNACIFCVKLHSIARVIQQYNLVLTHELHLYLRSIIKTLMSSKNYVATAAVSLRPFKELNRWVCTTEDYIYATPTEVHILNAGTMLQSVLDCALSSVAKLPLVGFTIRRTSSFIDHFYAAPPEVQMMQLQLLLRLMQEWLHSAAEAIREKIQLVPLA